MAVSFSSLFVSVFVSELNANDVMRRAAFSAG